MWEKLKLGHLNENYKTMMSPEREILRIIPSSNFFFKKDRLHINLQPGQWRPRTGGSSLGKIGLVEIGGILKMIKRIFSWISQGHRIPDSSKSEMVALKGLKLFPKKKR